MTNLFNSMLLSIVLLSPLARAVTVTCTANCVLDGKDHVVTVQSRGIDQQDAVIQLRKDCDAEGKKASSKSHFLATSVVQPNALHTAAQTEFDVQKACF